MKPERQAYFAISGEALLELVKRKSDLPKDAELVKLMVDADGKKPDFIDIANTARFIITSKEYPVIHEGEHLFRLSVRMKK